MPRAAAALQGDIRNLNPDERREAGKKCRETVHRVDQGQWPGRKSGVDPVAVLVAASKSRDQELLPIKWARMAASPFGFFRGAVPLMAADLATIPTTGIGVQICGDAHVRNLGAFAGPDGALTFDINDFDETERGPWEWDLKRYATSLVLAGREAGNSDSSCKEAIAAFVSDYRKTLDECAELTVLQLARYQVRRALAAQSILAVLRKAERATPQHSLEKLTVVQSNGARKFKESKPLLYRESPKTSELVLASLAAYKNTLLAERRHFFELYKPVDVAFKVVGTGSVGTRDYVVLHTGNGPQDALFLQVKEEPQSAYAPFLPSAKNDLHQGQRVVQGQRLMQAMSDIFLGWTTIEGRDYLVRQLNDHKAGIEIEDLKGRGLIEYGKISGEILAKGHTRSGDACLLSGYCGAAPKLDKAIAEFALAYAQQTESDYKQFLAAIKQGKLTVAKGILE